MKFQKANKTQSFARAAFFGPSGAGKTYSALAIATGLGSAIAVIDTERGSASKYSDIFDFDVLELEDRSVDGYIAAINLAAKEKYEVLIIDSLTHAWRELLEEVNRIAKAKPSNNKFAAWDEGTPKHKKLIDTMLTFPGHIIATMRSQTEWSIVNENGRNKPQRVGLRPEQGKGLEFEFDLLVELSTEHYANVIKDRSSKFQDRTIEKPGKEFGEELAEWLSHGSPMTKPVIDTGVMLAAIGSMTTPKDLKAWVTKNTEDINKLSAEDKTNVQSAARVKMAELKETKED